MGGWASASVELRGSVPGPPQGAQPLGADSPEEETGVHRAAGGAPGARQPLLGETLSGPLWLEASEA